VFCLAIAAAFFLILSRLLLGKLCFISAGLSPLANPSISVFVSSTVHLLDKFCALISRISLLSKLFLLFVLDERAGVREVELLRRGWESSEMGSANSSTFSSAAGSSTGECLLLARTMGGFWALGTASRVEYWEALLAASGGVRRG
jgi:hypothetical protein